MAIKVKGKRGLQKKALRVTIVTPAGREVELVNAEVDSLIVDRRRRRRKNKKYVELFRFGTYPYIALTKNVVTGRVSWVVRAGNHHYWLPLDKPDELKLLLYILYSYTLEYKSIDILEYDAVFKIPTAAIEHLRRKVAAAKAAYQKHLKAVRRIGLQ
jgi:hypothetical protein